MSDLKPCPFCGDARTSVSTGLGWDAIRCLNCEAIGPIAIHPTDETEPEARRLWNTRFPAPMDKETSE